MGVVSNAHYYQAVSPIFLHPETASIYTNHDKNSFHILQMHGTITTFLFKYNDIQRDASS
jgi:hypothetical protein